MKVLIITANWGGGGPGGVASDLYNKLKSTGNDCVFAYARGTAPPMVETYKIGTRFDVYLHVISARIFDNAGFMSKNATKKLIHFIQKFAPDIINIHNPLGYTINIEVLMNFIRESKILTVWTLHDCWAVTGHCIAQICDKYIVGCHHCKNKRAYPASYIFDRSRYNWNKKKKIFDNIDNLYFLTPSQWLADIVANSYLKHYPVKVINNGIDLSVFCYTESDLREKYHLVNKTVLIAVASVWSEFKGASYFNKLTKLLDDSFAFVIIGKLNDKKIKENKRLICIERTSNRKELAKWYSAADIFVNPTMGDNFPTVNIEALACGLPVVTFHTGGSSESVGNCGRVVPPGDVEVMAEKVIECSQLHISRDVCRKQAEKYDRQKKYMEYINYFHQLLGE